MNASVFDREFRLSPRKGGGISCDAEGVGEIALLELTDIGWVPRSPDILSKSLGEAYGLGIDFSTKQSALSAIATALNAGDVARAQIATLLTKLPDPPPLSKHAVPEDEAIKLAVLLNEAGILKYNNKHYPAHVPDHKGGEFAPKTASGVNASMSTSEAGQQFIKNNEWLKHKLYHSNGKGDWTIGYGHRVRGAEHKIYDHAVLSDSEAEALFQSDLKIAEDAVRTGVKFRLTQNQFDALTDFAFNVGAHGLDASYTLSLLNSAEDFSSYKFGDLTYAEGTWASAFGDPGRRQKEIDFFNKPTESPPLGGGP